jgi:glutaredoxin 3
MKYKIYATQQCPFCAMAKNMLERKGYDFEYLILEASSDIITEIKNITQQQTVPLIFEVDDNGRENFIGGYAELTKKICKI